MIYEVVYFIQLIAIFPLTIYSNKNKHEVSAFSTFLIVCRVPSARRIKPSGNKLRLKH